MDRTVNTKLIRGLLIVALLLNILGLIGSASRTATLGLGLSITYIIYYSFANRKFRRAMPIVVLVIIFVFMVIQLQYSSVFLERWSDVLGSGMQSTGILLRKDATQVGLRMAADRPLLGYGYGQVEENSIKYSSEYGKYVAAVSTTDNQYVDIFLKTGLFGLLLFLLSLMIIWRNAKKRTPDIFGKEINMIIKANILSFFIAGFGVPSFAAPITSMLFWLIVSIAYIDEK